MKRSRCIGVGILSLAVASLPAVTNAASYKHFVSKPLHFAIDYPTGWIPAFSATSAYETFQQSSSIALTVNYHPAAGFTIKSFTSKLIAAYRKSGITSNPATFSGNRGEFTGSGTVVGHKVLVDVVTLLTPHGAFSLAAACPKAQLPKEYPLFHHMFLSFTSM